MNRVTIIGIIGLAIGILLLATMDIKHYRCTHAEVDMKGQPVCVEYQLETNK